MCIRALAGKEKVLGLELRSTLDTLNKIGLVYFNQSNVDLPAQRRLTVVWGGC